MGRLTMCVMFVFLQVSVVWAETTNKPIVAVFDVEAKGAKDLDGAFLDGLSDFLAARLVETGQFQVVPRSALKERLAASKKESFKACYDQSCQIEMGRELAAEKTLAAQVVKLGSTCTITLSLFDLKRAATEKAATEQCNCDADAVLAGVKSALRKLVGQKEVKASSGTWQKSWAGLETSAQVISLEQFRRVLDAHRDDFLRCVRTRKKIFGKARAKRNATLEITVGPGGGIKKLKVTPRKLRKRAPARCIKKALLKLRFPAAQKSVTYNHVFRVN